MDVLNDLPRTGVRIAGRMFAPGADRGVAAMLTAASWVLQRLPGQVVEGQRDELIRTLSQARNLVVEVHCAPAALVRVRDGQRVLVEIPAEGRQEGPPRASRARDAGRKPASRPPTPFCGLRNAAFPVSARRDGLRSPDGLARTGPAGDRRALAPQRAVLRRRIAGLPGNRQAAGRPVPGDGRDPVRASGNLPNPRPRGAGAARRRHGRVPILR